MTRRIISVWVIALFLLGIRTYAQAGPHSHPTSETVTIKGSEHPEAFSDSDVFRMFFLNLTQESPKDQPTKEAIQSNHFKALGMTDVEIRAAFFALEEFRTKYDAILKEYNEHEDTKNFTSAQLPSLIAKRDALVEQTRNQLNIMLSKESAQILNKYIVAHKAMMVRVEAQ